MDNSEKIARSRLTYSPELLGPISDIIRKSGEDFDPDLLISRFTYFAELLGPISDIIRKSGEDFDPDLLIQSILEALVLMLDAECAFLLLSSQAGKDGSMYSIRAIHPKEYFGKDGETFTVSDEDALVKIVFEEGDYISFDNLSDAVPDSQFLRLGINSVLLGPFRLWERAGLLVVCNRKSFSPLYATFPLPSGRLDGLYYGSYETLVLSLIALKAASAIDYLSKKRERVSKPELPRFEPPKLSFEEFLKLSDEEKNKIDLETYYGNESWIKENLKDFDWILVVKGEVYKASHSSKGYPRYEELMEIGRRTNSIPFVFDAPALIEESNTTSSAWSPLKGGIDYYPTIEIRLLEESGPEKPNEKVKILVADFDTGSPVTFLDSKFLSRERVLGRYPLKPGIHLNRPYRYYRNWIRVQIRDESGKLQSRPMVCRFVRDWQASPFCIVNPNRNALVGRDMLMGFHLEVELNSKDKITRIFHL